MRQEVGEMHDTRENINGSKWEGDDKSGGGVAGRKGGGKVGGW